jgi:hypothetical protein
MNPISRVAIGDPPLAAKQNEIIDVANMVLGANAASGVTVKQQGGALNFSKRPRFRAARTFAHEYAARNMDRDEAFLDIGDMVSLIKLTNVPSLNDTKGVLNWEVSTYHAEAGEGDDETPARFGVVTEAMNYDKPGKICLDGLVYVKAVKSADLGDHVPYGIILLDGEVTPEVVPYQGTWSVIGMADDPTEEGGDEYWVLIHLDHPQLPELYVATSDVSDGEINGKRVLIDETPVGEDMTWPTYGSSPGS